MQGGVEPLALNGLFSIREFCACNGLCDDKFCGELFLCMVWTKT